MVKEVMFQLRNTVFRKANAKIGPFLAISIFLILAIRIGRLIAIGGTPDLALYVSLFLCAILLLTRNWHMAVILFMIFAPITRLWPEGTFPLPGVNPQNILSILVIGLAIMDKKKWSLNINRAQRLAMIYILGMHIMQIYILTKDTLFVTISYVDLLTGIAGTLLRMSAVLFILSDIRNEDSLAAVNKGLVAGTIIIGFSSVLGAQLEAVGVAVHGYTFGSFAQAFRSSGLYAGHPTQYSAFLAMCIGYCLARTEVVKRRKGIYFLGIIASSAGILFSAGLAGFYAAIVIFIIYLLKNRKGIRVFQGIIIMLLLLVLINYLGDIMLQRASTTADYC